MVINSKNTFYATKRLIGRRFTDPEVKKLQDAVSFKIVASPKGSSYHFYSQKFDIYFFTF